MALFRTLLLLLLLTAPAAAAQQPTLIGGGADEPLRYLDQDLEVIEGSPRIADGTSATHLSRDRSRFLAYEKAAGTITIRRRSGPLVATVALRTLDFSHAVFPARDRVMTLNTPIGRVRARSYEISTGRVQRTSFRGDYVDHGRIGSTTRVLIHRGSDYSVVDLAPDGTIRGRHPVPLPEGYADPAGSSYAALSGNYVIASGGVDTCAVVLARVDGAATVLDLDGCDVGFVWAGQNFITDEHGRIALIDRQQAAVVADVDLGDDFLGVVPYEGGVIAGLGRARFDANLYPVYEHAATETNGGGGVLVAHDRLYAPHGPDEPAGVRYASAATGEPLGDNLHVWQIGVLGLDHVHVPGVEDPDDDPCYDSA